MASCVHEQYDGANGYAHTNGVSGKADSLENIILAASSNIIDGPIATSFPYLDSIDHGLFEPRERSNSISFTRQRLPQPLVHSNRTRKSSEKVQPFHALKRYAAFILGLTGDDTCWISCRIHAEYGLQWSGYMRASRSQASSDGLRNLAIELEAIQAQGQSENDVSSEFSFEYRKCGSAKHAEDDVKTKNTVSDACFYTSSMKQSDNE
jgi:hypothetical protein